MNKKLILLLMAIAAITMNAVAKNYEINVGGVEVTDNNYNNVTGGNISLSNGGYVKYNPSTNTLTLYNVRIQRNSQDNYGIHNRKCDNLTIVFSGSCNILTSDNALKLERSTTLEAAANSSTLFYSAARICANLKSYKYYIKGSGNMRFEANQEAYEAIKGEGSSTQVYFQGAKVTAYSTQRSALSSFTAYLQSGTDLRIEGNGSNASVSGVSMNFSGNATILEPYGAVYSNNSVYDPYGHQITGSVYISSTYGAIINSYYFPDYNFREALLSLYPKGWMTSSELSSRTSLTVSNKGISDLEGVQRFSNLTYLDCSYNYISYIPTLPYGFKELNISHNHIMNADNACSTIQNLNVSYNQLSGMHTSRYNNLKTLNVSYNTSMTVVDCSNRVLTSLNVTGCSRLNNLDCRNNQLTSLNLSGCSSLTMLICMDNNISTFYSLPSSVQEIYCQNNNLSGTLDLSQRSALKKLNCDNNYLTGLNIQGCTSLTSVHCGSNNLTSLSFNGLSSLELLDCQLNTSLKTIQCTNNSKLKTIQVRNCSALTDLICNNNAIEELDIYGANNLTQLHCNYNKLTSINVANRTKLTELGVGYNQLTSVNVSGCTALQWLELEANRLSSLSVQGCNSLRTIYCCVNQIKESGAGTLVNSLCTIPAGTIGNLYFVSPGYSSNGYTEANAITTAQVKTARDKRWIPKKQVNGSWVDIPSVIPGDVNGDGHVTSVDATALYNLLLNNDGSEVVNGDQDGDGHITSVDITVVYNILLGGN